MKHVDSCSCVVDVVVVDVVVAVVVVPAVEVVVASVTAPAVVVVVVDVVVMSPPAVELTHRAPKNAGADAV